MTKIKNNSLLKGISGKFGETHSYRRIRGKMQMTALPDNTKPASARQVELKEKFLKAVNYAKVQMADVAMRELYQTGITRKKHNAHLVALSDSLNAPKVKEIKTDDYEGHIGEPISIEATDDFRVVRVRVIITDGNGLRLERGEAVQDTVNVSTWRYTATAVNPALQGTKISVTAFDIPDNETTLIKVVE